MHNKCLNIKIYLLESMPTKSVHSHVSYKLYGMYVDVVLDFFLGMKYMRQWCETWNVEMQSLFVHVKL